MKMFDPEAPRPAAADPNAAVTGETEHGSPTPPRYGEDSRAAAGGVPSVSPFSVTSLPPPSLPHVATRVAVIALLGPLLRLDPKIALTPLTRLDEDLAMGPLDRANLACAVEEAFAFALPDDEEIAEWQTVEDVARSIERAHLDPPCFAQPNGEVAARSADGGVSPYPRDFTVVALGGGA